MIKMTKSILETVQLPTVQILEQFEQIFWSGGSSNYRESTVIIYFWCCDIIIIVFVSINILSG